MMILIKKNVTIVAENVKNFYDFYSRMIFQKLRNHLSKICFDLLCFVLELRRKDHPREPGMAIQPSTQRSEDFIELAFDEHSIDYSSSL